MKNKIGKILNFILLIIIIFGLTIPITFGLMLFLSGVGIKEEFARIIVRFIMGTFLILFTGWAIYKYIYKL